MNVIIIIIHTNNNDDIDDYAKVNDDVHRVSSTRVNTVANTLKLPISHRQIQIQIQVLCLKHSGLLARLYKPIEYVF